MDRRTITSVSITTAEEERGLVLRSFFVLTKKLTFTARSDILSIGDLFIYSTQFLHNLSKP